MNINHPKSIDFVWDLVVAGAAHLRFFASHKFTQDEGGSQDNQFNDLMAFVGAAAQLQRNVGRQFLALGDGPFYERCRQSAAPDTRLDELRRQCAQTPFVEAMKTWRRNDPVNPPPNDLPRYLAKIVRGIIATRAGGVATAAEQQGLAVLDTI